jgi:cobalt-precorrin 5A hydrolase
MKLAAITLCDQGARITEALDDRLDQCDTYLHQQVATPSNAPRFASVLELTGEIFGRYDGLIYVMPTGVVVRAIAGHIVHKKSDPAIVAVDVGGRWAVSLLSGHEGGANDLAVMVSNIIGAEPVISTTTEAVKDIIVGIGCRRGAAVENIRDAIMQALSLARCQLSQVRLLASADIKADEPGLIEAAQSLSLPIRFIPAGEIRTSLLDFQHSTFVQNKVDLPAVAEPAALLAGRRTQLILPKQIINSVTVAIARENCMSLA